MTQRQRARYRVACYVIVNNITTATLESNIKCNWRVLCKNFDNQTITDIQISLTNYEGLFRLMLQLHVASTSNEITLVGDYMKSDLLPTGIMPELRQSNNNWYSTKSYGLWRVISFHVTTACCLTIKRNYFGRRSHEKWFSTDGHHARTPATNNDWHSAKSFGLWRVILFDVTTACCLKFKWKNSFI